MDANKETSSRALLSNVMLLKTLRYVGMFMDRSLKETTQLAWEEVARSQISPIFDVKSFETFWYQGL